MGRTEREAISQLDWMRDHGGNESGYILNYGLQDGLAIYAADCAAFDRIINGGKHEHH